MGSYTHVLIASLADLQVHPERGSYPNMKGRLGARREVPRSRFLEPLHFGADLSRPSPSTWSRTKGPSPHEEDRQAKENQKQEVQHQQECEQPNFSQPNADAGEHRPSVWQSHSAGTCLPCIFFNRKADGCRRGDACSHCHFCTVKEAKRRRNKLCRERRVARGWA